MTGWRLFVDDHRPIPEGWIGCRTVSEAIRTLATLPVAEVSLDHDILFPASGASVYLPLSQETFMGVAYYIAAMPASARPRRVRVHTGNVGAAMSMCDVMGVRFDEAYKVYDMRDYACSSPAQAAG